MEHHDIGFGPRKTTYSLIEEWSSSSPSLHQRKQEETFRDGGEDEYHKHESYRDSEGDFDSTPVESTWGMHKLGQLGGCKGNIWVIDEKIMQAANNVAINTRISRWSYIK